MASNSSEKTCTPDTGDNNIQVFVRIRPPGGDEPTYSRVVSVDPSGRQAILRQNETNTRVFSFDHVADVEATQESIFSTLGRKVIDNCIGGYNGTIFAYGQTGSGKTFTMMGPSEDSENFRHEMRGVIPRSFEYLYNSIQREKELHGDNKQFLCKCSFLEIYKEQIFDLLEPSATTLHLRESFKTGVYVEGLTEQVVSDATEAYEVLTSSWMNRRVASTAMNRESSRSHAVFTLQVESKERKGTVENIRTSSLNLVDLAGSERQKDTLASGQRLKEAGSINKSLSNLGNVIMSLVIASRDDKKKFIPYRDSKLTFLLRDSLGGNSKTSLIACVHPGHKCYGETLSTLQFAKRAKMIKNKAVLNENSHGNVQQLQLEIHALKDELAKWKAQGSIPSQLSAVPTEGSQVLREMFLQAMMLQQKTELEKIELHDNIKELRSVLQKKDKSMQTNKMIIKFRENNISRLEAKLKGAEPVDERMENLEKENDLLRSQYEHHPTVAMYSLEIQQLKATVKHLKHDTGILANIDTDSRRVAQLEAKYKELQAECGDPGEDEDLTTPQRAVAVSTATLEKLRSQVADLEAEVGELKQTLNDVKQAGEKKEIFLTSELESYKQTVKELEMVIAANNTKNKLEKAAMNDMHNMTIQNITTPKKECYKLRSRTVVSVSSDQGEADLDTSIAYETQPEEAGILDEDQPESLLEQANEALREQIKQLQDKNVSLDGRISEYEADRVKNQQQLSMLQSQLQHLEEIYEREKQTSADLRDQYASVEPKMKEMSVEKGHYFDEVQDLRILLSSADKELKETKQKLKAKEADNVKEIEKVESQLMHVDVIVQQVTKANEKLEEEKETMEMSLETETQTRMFLEELMSKLEATLAEKEKNIKEIEHNLHIAEKTIMDEKELQENLLDQLSSEGQQKDKEVILRKEENSRLQVEYESLKNMVEGYEDSATTLRRTIDDRDKDLKYAEQNLKHAQEKLSEQYVRTQEDSNTITDLKQNVDSLQEQVDVMKTAEIEMLATEENLRKQIDVNTERIQTEISRREIEMDMVNEDMKCLQSSLDEVKGEYERSQEQLTKVEEEKESQIVEITKLKELLKQKEEATVELSCKDQELYELTQQLEELENVRVQRSEEIIVLKEKLHSEESSHGVVRRELETIQLQYQESVERVEKQNGEIEELKEKLVESSSQCSQALEDVQKSDKHISLLGSNVTQLYLDVEELKRENQDLEDTEKRLKDLAQKDHTEKCQLQADLDNLQLGLQSIKALYADILCPETSRMDDLVTSIRTTKEDNEKLQTENSHLVGHNNHKQKIKYHEMIKQENSQLKKEIASLDAKYKILLDQHKDTKNELKVMSDVSHKEKRVLKENLLPAHRTFLSGDYTKYQGKL